MTRIVPCGSGPSKLNSVASIIIKAIYWTLTYFITPNNSVPKSAVTMNQAKGTNFLSLQLSPTFIPTFMLLFVSEKYLVP